VSSCPIAVPIPPVPKMVMLAMLGFLPFAYGCL